MKIGLMHGPNLDRLGEREVGIYGKITLVQLIAQVKEQAKTYDLSVVDFQSNHEGELIDTLWAWKDAGVKGVIINPGGLSHTSVSLRDAMAGAGYPIVETHLTNIHAREDFRNSLITARACLGVISGLGPLGYKMAVEALAKYFIKNSEIG